MKKVLIRAPLLSQSGYGVHSRQIFQFCQAQKDWEITSQVLPWGITPWNVSHDMEGGIYGQIMSTSKPANGIFDLSLQVQLPHEWDEKLARFNIGVTAGVETTRSSSEWVNLHVNKMDLVIVPSEFAKKTLENSATVKIKTPIVVLPEAYFPKLLSAPSCDPLQHLETEHNFLTVGTLTSDASDSDRKNLISSLVWFLKAFDGKPNVGLIVKTSRGRDTTIDRELVRKLLKQVRLHAGVSGPKSPKLYMLHGPMTREEMRDLYKSPKLTAYMSATRGEGFGLPLLEAAVTGLPVVATDWSAHTEFLEGDSFLRAKYDLKEIPQSRVDGKIFVKGAMWAEAREGNFVRKLKTAVTDSKKLKLSAADLTEKLRETHSMNSLQKKFEEIITEYV